MFTNAQIAEALNTVLEINADNTPRIAFFEYMGHTSGMQIDINPLGWDDEDKKKRDYHINFSGYADTNHLESRTYRGRKVTEIHQYENFSEMLKAIKEVGS